VRGQVQGKNKQEPKKKKYSGQKKTKSTVMNPSDAK
jgi:hypothetical protein